MADLSRPWFHTTYLIARDLVVQNEISYPDLIDGEDPVFIADVLVDTRTISAIPDITYLCRTGGGTRRENLRHVIDFVRSAAAVRRLYLERQPGAWTRGYGPFLSSRFNECFCATGVALWSRAP